MKNSQSPTEALDANENKYLDPANYENFYAGFIITHKGNNIIFTAGELLQIIYDLTLKHRRSIPIDKKNEWKIGLEMRILY